jgi:hypothetical protein
MVCPKCKTHMNPGSSRGNAWEYLCPGCGYRTLGAKDPSAPPQKLGSVPSQSVPWQMQEDTNEKTVEADARPPQPSGSRRRSKPSFRKTEKPDPFLLELQAELKILTSQIVDLETSLGREVQRLKARLGELEAKIAEKTRQA